MHAPLGRRWKTRVEGRDWYDFVRFAANRPKLHLAHLRERMVQSAHWPENKPLTERGFRKSLRQATHTVDLGAAKKEVSPFVTHLEALDVCSPEVFSTVADKVEIV